MCRIVTISGEAVKFPDQHDVKQPFFAVLDHLLEIRAVIAHDDVVDDLFNKVKAELIAMIHEDVNAGEQASDLLMAAKYFERIGDHATNISEWVIFSITGQHPDDK